MSKRPNLAAALHDAGARPAQAKAAVVPIAAPVAVDPPVADTRGSTSTRAPSREGQRAVTTYVSPEAHAQLSMLAIERGQKEKRKVSTQELMTEALNDLFRKHGKSQIA
jgi:hypothetical protein